MRAVVVRAREAELSRLHELLSDYEAFRIPAMTAADVLWDGRVGNRWVVVSQGLPQAYEVTPGEEPAVQGLEDLLAEVRATGQLSTNFSMGARQADGWDEVEDIEAELDRHRGVVASDDSQPGAVASHDNRPNQAGIGHAEKT